MSPVMFDHERGTFVIVDTICCGESMYDTGCDAPGCTGYLCQECGEGCDIEIDPEDGACGTLQRNESDVDRLARHQAQRKAFGLSPLTEADGA